MSNLIDINEIFVSYGSSIMAVQGSSLYINKGELVALLGNNGAGKSTIVKAVLGELPLYSGEIIVDGVSVTSKAYHPVRSGIGYVPENRGIFHRLTVGENLKLGACSRNDKSGIKDDLEKLLHRFPVLDKYWTHGASLLSGGEQQQLAIARALIMRPNILLLDEPSLGLAPVLVNAIFNTIAELHSEGMSILLVEQNAALSLKVADRSYIIRSPGLVVGEGSETELSQNTLVTEHLGFKPGERS